MKTPCPSFVSGKPLHEVQGVKCINTGHVVSLTTEDSEYWGELCPHSEKKMQKLCY